MLSSTQDYLNALRQGNYVAFLEWPQFVGRYYQHKDEGLAADELVNLLLFEALNHGFSLDDVRAVALVCSVREKHGGLLRGVLDYALTSITVVSIQCMMYWRADLTKHLLTSNKLTSKEIERLISSSNALMEQSLQVKLESDQNSFYRWIEEASAESIEPVKQQLTTILSLRNSADDYIALLEINQSKTDRLQLQRLSVLKRLALYLNNNSQLSDDVAVGIAQYVAMIWQLNPAQWEEEHLNQLSPLSLEHSFWQGVTSMGTTFFKLLQPEDEHIASTSDTNNP